MGYPMLDPERDLKGATPEKLARALLRPRRKPLADREREQEGQYGADADRERPQSEDR